MISEVIDLSTQQPSREISFPTAETSFDLFAENLDTTPPLYILDNKIHRIYTDGKQFAVNREGPVALVFTDYNMRSFLPDNLQGGAETQQILKPYKLALNYDTKTPELYLRFVLEDQHDSKQVVALKLPFYDAFAGEFRPDGERQNFGYDLESGPYRAELLKRNVKISFSEDRSYYFMLTERSQDNWPAPPLYRTLQKPKFWQTKYWQNQADTPPERFMGIRMDATQTQYQWKFVYGQEV